MNGYQSDFQLNNINYHGNFPLENLLGGFGVTIGTTDDQYELSMDPPITAYQKGMPFWVMFHQANKGMATLNVDGLGSKSIKKVENGIIQPVDKGDLGTDKIYQLSYTGLYFQLLNTYYSPIIQATEGTVGGARIATEEDVFEGTNDAVIVTPEKLSDYLDDTLEGFWKYKGALDCAASPAYPAGMKGDVYTVSVSGKIGGSSGKAVKADDVIFCTDNNAGGDHSAVGVYWKVLSGEVVLTAATETQAGITRIATQDEVNTGENDTTFVTPIKLRYFLDEEMLATEFNPGIVQLASIAEVFTGTNNSKFISPYSLKFLLDQLTGRELVFSLDATKINPILATTTNRDKLSLINGNFLMAKDFRLVPTASVPVQFTNVHVLNLPKPLNNPGGMLSGVVLSNLGEVFQYSMDTLGRLRLTGTFNQAVDELTFNFYPYMVKYPLEYYSDVPS